MARFTPEEAAAWGGFLASYSRLDRAIDAYLIAKDGIRHVEFEVLLRLRWVPGHRMRIQDLAANSLLTRSGTSRLVDRLERAGLVTRDVATEDRRGAYAVLTDRGREKFDLALPRHIDFVRDQFHRKLTRTEIDTLAKIWSKLAT